MTRNKRLFRRLMLLSAVGILSYLIDAWAKQNSIIVLGIIEFGLLALWVGVDINEIGRGTLKAGPEPPAKSKAIYLPKYQLLLAVYCVVLAGVAVFGAKHGLVSRVINSPFLVWLLAAPAVAVAFIMEYSAEGNWRET